MKEIAEKALKHGGIVTAIVALVLAVIYYYHHFYLGKVPLVLLVSFYGGCYGSLIYQLAKMFKF